MANKKQSPRPDTLKDAIDAVSKARQQQMGRRKGK